MPDPTQTPHTDDPVVARVAERSEAAVRSAFSESWDVPAAELEVGLWRYAEALIRSVKAGNFDELEAYLISLDAIWKIDQFAVSPIIRAMFIIEDITCEQFDTANELEIRHLTDLTKEFTRRAIECVSERSVALVMGQLAQQVEGHREGEARLMSLQRVGSALVSDLDLDRTLQLIADEARSLIGADGVLIRMANEHGDLGFVTGSGGQNLFMPGMSLSPDSSLSGEALKSGTPRCVKDIRTDPHVNRDYLNVSAGRSLLIVPLVAREQPVGVITGISATIGAFSDQDVSILSLFADQASSAVQNARLFQQAHQQIEELDALHRSSQLVSSSLDLEQVFQILYEEVARLMPADAFMVALTRPDGLHDFEFVVDDGRRFPPRRGFSLSPIFRDLLENAETLITRDLRQHPAYRYADRFGNTERESKSVLAVPLMRGDQVIGMITAQSYAEHDYRDPEARTLRTIASYAAIAIEHARLYREAQNVAVVEERGRLAREIHDTLAQGLFGVILCLERMDLAVPEDDTCYRPWIDRALELSRSSLEEARRSVRDLRAAPLEGRTLLEAVANLVANVRDEHSFEVVTTFPTSLPPLSARVETALFRVVQEAISNACKHSDCNKLAITVETDAATLRVQILDDGNGFEPKTASNKTERYGLTTMRERILQIGGELDIQSAPDTGTTVQIELPIPVAVHRETHDENGTSTDDP